MDRFLSSLSRWFGEKTSNPLYFTYIGFFVAWNWKFFQLVFLENESLFSAPRIEYISSKLFVSIPPHAGLYPWVTSSINQILNVFLVVLPPLIFTYLVIVCLPRIYKWVFIRDINSDFERKRILETKQHEYDLWRLGANQERMQTLEAIAVVTQEQEKIQKKIEASTSDETLWAFEYADFEKSHSFSTFKQVIEIMYKLNGFLEEGHNRQQAYIEALAVADTRGLLSYPENERNLVKLTKKGKSFVKLYLEKHPLS